MLWRRFASLLLRAVENQEIFATTSTVALRFGLRVPGECLKTEDPALQNALP